MLEIIDKEQMPQGHCFRGGQSPIIREILGAYPDLPPVKRIKYDAGSALGSKRIANALRYYSRGQAKTTLYPNLCVASRGQYVFCWKEE